MRIVSWNVNGLRSILKKDFSGAVSFLKPDILCLQETRVNQEAIATIDFECSNLMFNNANRKGYSGTAIFSKLDTIAVDSNTVLDSTTGEKEGRVIVVEYDKFFLVNVYTPNSKPDLSRLEFRQKIWDPEFLKLLLKLESTKPVIACGDFNVAHQEIDLENPDHNHFSNGFTDEERSGFSNYIASGFLDSYRHFYPEEKKAYSWWSYRMKSRERNVGWRLDYILISRKLQGYVDGVFIFNNVYGSDHAPVGIDIRL
ncbi:MAG: exodeoxyribonuclease III [Puniceicoccales bacterium]|jgi:exodeoxyribonuclease-3|nr:exodeoxyribonuclease III [Puniceicoccales bacterium]